MNAIVKEKWLEALRSGRYKQRQRQLHSDDSFCCLGVLCDLHALETGGKWINGVQYLGRCCFLPIEVNKWAGTADDEGDLASMNDKGKSFAEIADYIEEKL